MSRVWDYNQSELQKSEAGRILLLERMINYGPVKGEKIPLKLVKKHWDKLHLFPLKKRLFELLLWKDQSFPQTNKKSLPK